MNQRLLERIMGTAFVFLGIYLLLTFYDFLEPYLTRTAFQSDTIYVLEMVTLLVSGILLIISAIALWLDSGQEPE